jgi:hypothetical protein
MAYQLNAPLGIAFTAYFHRGKLQAPRPPKSTAIPASYYPPMSSQCCRQLMSVDLDVQAIVQLVHLQPQRPPNKLRGGSEASRGACRKVVQASTRGETEVHYVVDKQTTLINRFWLGLRIGQVGQGHSDEIGLICQCRHVHPMNSW